MFVNSLAPRSATRRGSIRFLAVLASLLTLVDAVATYAVTRYSLDAASAEGNPVLAALMPTLGAGWTLTGRALFGLVGVALLVLATRSPCVRFGVPGLAVVTGALTLLAGFHAYSWAVHGPELRHQFEVAQRKMTCLQAMENAPVAEVRAVRASTVCDFSDLEA